jgi:hypothetical protein
MLKGVKIRVKKLEREEKGHQAWRASRSERRQEKTLAAAGH